MKNDKEIKVAILEDEISFRENAELLLNSTEDIICIKTYGGEKEFLNDFKNIFPDVYWLDLHLLDGSGINVIQHIKRHRPKARCLVCSFFDNEDEIFEALKSGADGYIMKSEENSKILEAVRELHLGGAPMSRIIARKVFSFFTKSEVVPANMEHLSKREYEILQELSKGFIYKEIASKLFISAETVKKHIQNIYIKLHVNNRTEAVVKFLNKQEPEF
jgi:DNA-binding NarL/FixJ family response regulator